MNRKKRIAYAKAKHNHIYWLGYDLPFRYWRQQCRLNEWHRAVNIHRSALHQTLFGLKTEADPEESHWLVSDISTLDKLLDKRQRKRMERKWGVMCKTYHPDCASCVAWAYAIEFRKVTTFSRADVLYPLCWGDK
jgi:hypothetical protein